MTKGAAGEVVPLLAPSGGVPPVVSDAAALALVAGAIAAGRGPVAVDAERASGYRYTQRAYLVQLRREPVGTALVDPIGLPPHAFAQLADALSGTEWVLHAASQDLPCLAELGLVPSRLFDTELAGRLAGYERVGLAAMVQQTLGVGLRKGHGAADWSLRPLPHDWLTYAALDVELLLPLREALVAELSAQGKLAWAEQEFEAVRLAPPAVQRAEPWRRTSGIHRIRRPRQLAAVRELWLVRDELAMRRDLAPGRVLPDAAIVDAAIADPPSVADLTRLPVFRGRAQRRLAQTWTDALDRARRLPRSGLPEINPNTDGPPPPNRWADKDPAAAARLTAARAALNAIAERHRLPVENLLQPELVRRLCWQPPDGAAPAAVDEALRSGGARQWQRDLTVDALSAALTAADTTSGGRIVATPDSTSFPITIYLADESIYAQVEAAVDDLLAFANGHVEHREDPIIGSWFRRMRAKIERSPAAQDAIMTAAHAADSRLFLAQDATVTATMLQNLGPVLTALQPTKEAVIRAGALLIVKVDDVVAVHQLTAAQQLRLDHQPHLARSPQEILSALELTVASPTQFNGLNGPPDSAAILPRTECSPQSGG